ncbi:hypothetical protein AMTRI_Chr09g34860 [Amborella trichopoda]
MQSVPGLIILYGSVMKKKWAVNSAFMALYAFAAVLICWVCWVTACRSGAPPCPYGAFFLAFTAITVILFAGSLLGRMNFYAWMLFVLLWLTLSYTVGAFNIWGGGFLEKMGIVDFSSGYVIHLSSGIAGFTAAYWVGPRISLNKKKFPPNNIIHMLGGEGLLWLGWTSFNGGPSCAANMFSALAILNTHLCTDTSLLMWLSLDSSMAGWFSCSIAGIVEPWAAVLMGAVSGSLPWYTMMMLHRSSSLLQKVDDPLNVSHTHTVAGFIGGILSGLFAQPNLTSLFYKMKGDYRKGFHQMAIQVMGAAFIAVWKLVVTSAICLVINQVVPLRMAEVKLKPMYCGMMGRRLASFNGRLETA